MKAAKCAVFALAAVSLFALPALGGCETGFGLNDSGTYAPYDGAEGYAAGDGRATASSLEIDWQSGNVTVRASETATEISYAETTAESDPDLLLRARVEEGQLELKFAAPRAKLPGGFSKDLEVIVPARLLEEVEIESVSGSVRILGVNAVSVAVEGVSSDIYVSGCTFGEGDFESVSGDVTLVLGEVGFRCRFLTVSGRVADGYSAIQNGSVYAYGDGRVELEVTTVSGDLALRRTEQTTEPGPSEPSVDPPRTDTYVYDRYDRPDSYSVGGGEAASVSAIEIDWHGDVVIRASADVRQVTFFEETSETEERNLMRYRVERGELDIEYAASGAILPVGLNKTLTVLVPVGVSLVDLEVDGARGTVTVEGVAAYDLTLDTTEGDIRVSGATFYDGEFDTDSGDITLSLSRGGFRCKFETRLGTLRDLIGTQQQWSEYVYGDGRSKISAETVSGDLTLQWA